MKKILTILVVSVIFSGCNYYMQICEIKTTNTKTIYTDNFVFDNDTVKITYAFWVEGGVFAFSIYNKIDKPIYVDWKNSSFIYNNDKVNYWIDEQQTNSSSLYLTNYYKNANPFINPLISSIGGSSTSSNTIKPERVTFIPPKSNYYRYQFAISKRPFYLFKIKDFTKSQQPPTRVKEEFVKEFSYENSPLKLRNYIAYTLTENSQNFSFVDNEFYLARIKEINLADEKPNEDYILSTNYKSNFSYYIRVGRTSTTDSQFYWDK